MKVLFSFLLAFTLMGSMAQAQLLRLGIKGGLNFSDVDVATSVSQGQIPSFNSATRWHIGGFARIGLGIIGVQPELLISSKGGVAESTGSTSDLNLTYANIPVVVVFKPIPLISIHAGPEFGILLSANQDGQDVKDTFANSDLGIAIGAGIHLPLGLEGGLRYIIGTNEVANIEITDFGQVLGNANFKNRVFQVYVGWAFIK